MNANLNSSNHPPLSVSITPRTEPELRIGVLQWLEEQGIVVGGRVVCAAGEPDVVSADLSILYELKLRLTRKSIYSGVGQLLIYRQCLNPLARVVLIGLPTPDIYALLPLVQALDIEVVIWERGLSVEGQHVAAQDNIHRTYASSVKLTETFDVR